MVLYQRVARFLVMLLLTFSSLDAIKGDERQEEQTPDAAEATRLYREGRSLHADERYTEAIDAYTHSLEISPDPLVYFARGVAWRDSREFQKAIGDFNRAIECNAKLVCAYTYRGACRYELGDVNRAQADLTTAVDLDPKDADMWKARAHFWYRLKEYELAVADLDEAIRIDPHHVPALMLRAQSQLGLHNYKLAIAGLNELIEQEPTNTRAYVWRAIAWGGLGKCEQMMANLKAAYVLDADEVDAFFGWVVVGQLDTSSIAADGDPKEADARKVKEVTIHVVLGAVKQRLELFADALEYYEKAIELDDRSVPANRVFAEFLATCPEKEFRDYERALRLAKTSCELTEWQNPDCLLLLAKVHAESGNFKEAIAWQEKAIELTPEDSKSDAEKTLKLYQAERTSTGESKCDPTTSTLIR